MKTKWIASREFSSSPGRTLKAVSQSGRVLVTSNGKPKAIMIPTSEDTYAHDLAMLDRAILGQAVAAIRAESVRQDTDTISSKEIDAEIAATRSSRKRK